MARWTAVDTLSSLGGQSSTAMKQCMSCIPHVLQHQPEGMEFIAARRTTIASHAAVSRCIHTTLYMLPDLAPRQQAQFFQYVMRFKYSAIVMLITCDVAKVGDSRVLSLSSNGPFNVKLASVVITCRWARFTACILSTLGLMSRCRRTELVRLVN